jgi:hypothetical protein
LCLSGLWCNGSRPDPVVMRRSKQVDMQVELKKGWGRGRGTDGVLWRRGNHDETGDLVLIIGSF